MQGPLTRAGRLVRWFVRPFAGQETSFYRAITACLLAAGVFWQMNALNKTYTTHINFPLHWHYDSVRYVPLRPLPPTLPVVVTGQGWRLLRANMGWGTHPADLRPVSRPGTRYLPASGHQSLQNALEGVQVTEWAGDTLRLTFDRCISRRLPLGLPADSARRYKAIFSPAAVTFRGPATLVNSLPSPYPVALPAASADEDMEVPIILPARVRATVSSVHISLTPVSQPRSRRHRATTSH
ncbi:YbbR-like domain-containing protein [Hymenobacter daeguensis]